MYRNSPGWSTGGGGGGDGEGWEVGKLVHNSEERTRKLKSHLVYTWFNLDEKNTVSHI